MIGGDFRCQRKRGHFGDYLRIYKEGKKPWGKVAVRRRTAQLHQEEKEEAAQKKKNYFIFQRLRKSPINFRKKEKVS